jgi:hypothetical protein
VVSSRWSANCKLLTVNCPLSSIHKYITTTCPVKGRNRRIRHKSLWCKEIYFYFFGNPHILTFGETRRAVLKSLRRKDFGKIGQIIAKNFCHLVQIPPIRLMFISFSRSSPQIHISSSREQTASWIRWRGFDCGYSWGMIGL